MIKKFLIRITIAAIALLGVACQQSTESNANANANTGETATTTTAGPDNSDITTTTDKNGVKTETRTFRNNPRVSKVVVTTSNGSRTVKVYSPSGEERELKNQPEKALDATGDAIADAAGWVKDKSVTAADKTKEGAKTVADKTVDTSKKVTDKTVDTSKTVANKSKAGAKTVVDETKEGVRKTGKQIKKILNP
jgi:Tfp pilus assembly protein PilV